MQNLLLHPPYVDPDVVFLVAKYIIWSHMLLYAAFRAVTEADWLEQFCDNNRDADLYQLGGPP